MNGSRPRRALARHWPLLAIAAAAAAPIFWNLGGSALWADEGDTAFYARSIRRSGLPLAWDGASFVEADSGGRLGGSLLMVGTPWLPYYAASASTAVFGESALSLRAPFALSGLACLALLYFLVLEATGDAADAALAAFLLAASLQFVLDARTARYPSLAMALSLWLALETFRLEKPRAAPRWAAAAVLLFLSHPLPALAGGAAAAARALLRAPRSARPLARAALLAAPVCAAWLWFSSRGLGANVQWLGSPAELWPRALQFAVEWLGVAPLVAWAALAAENRRAEGSALGRDGGGRADLAVYLLLQAAFTAAGFLATQSAYSLYDYGVRYSPGLIAFGAAMTALLLAPLRRRRPAAAAAVVLLLIATHLGGATAFWLLPPVRPGAVWPGGRESASPHEPPALADKFLQTDWPAFLADLRSPPPGTVARASALLRAVARPGDILITNYAWGALAFHTGLRLGATVLPQHPSADAALAAGLPQYVFSGAGASWLLWRWPWEDFQGYRFALVSRMLERQGARLVPEARIPETIWENRTNRHFRRYAGTGVIYSSVEPHDYPPALLYRVEWPPAPSRRAAAKP